jgi:hypothetical protein
LVAAPSEANAGDRLPLSRVTGNAGDADRGKPDKRQHSQRKEVVIDGAVLLRVGEARNVRREARGGLASDVDV